jgi:RNA polymerase sigma factor (sigma-70 family)
VTEPGRRDSSSVVTDQVVTAAPIASETWGEAHRRLWPSLARALTAATGTFEGVEDALQDAFVSGLRQPVGSYRALEGWLFVVALNSFRRRRRRDAFLRILRRAPIATDALAQTVLRADLNQSLAQLGARDRELLVAKYYVGLSQEDIARGFGLKRSAVAMAISRAAERFRSLGGTQ